MRIAVFATSRSDFEVASHLADAIKSFEATVVHFYVNDALVSLFPPAGATPLGVALRDGSSDEYRNLIDAVHARIAEHKFDVGLLIGDRWETLLIAQVLVSMNVKLIHHSGGDLTNGSLDNAYRYGCSMLASVHWVSAQSHGDRLTALGVPADQVFFVGEPQLESKKRSAQDVTIEKLGFGFDFSRRYILVCIHPSIDLTQDFDFALSELKLFLEAQPFNVLFTAPNHDPGVSDIMKYLEDLVSRHSDWRIVESLGSAFASVLSKSVCLLGNSSAGMFEAPILGVPVINLGSRQNGRLRAANIIDCPFKADQLHEALKRTVSMRRLMFDSPYFNEDWKNVVRTSLELLMSKSYRPCIGVAL